MPLGIDINSKDNYGNTPLLKLFQVYQEYGHEIKKRLTILIECKASLQPEDNKGIDVVGFIKDNDLLFEADLEEHSRLKKRQRI